MNFKTTSLASRKKLFLKAREQYYNSGNSELTDLEFDALEDSIREEEPKWEPLHSTGISVPKKFEVELAESMPSLDKIKSDVPESVVKWLNKVKQVHPKLHISEKIDGSSIQAVYQRGKLTQLATRGDGFKGKDISGFIPYVNLPRLVKNWKNETTVVIRLEATIPLKVYNARYQGSYDSDRAMASAILNRQDVSPALRHIEFVALRILAPCLPITASKTLLKEEGFLTPRSAVRSIDDLTVENLSDLALKMKESSCYSLDGLVLFTCSPNELHIKTDDRPEYARAFKLNDLENAVETEIIDIQWNPSSFGVVVPKAIVKPIKFGNVTVKQAALHNAAWAKQRGAGIGAKVKLIRSGEIIPKIVEVVEPSKLTIPLEKGSWTWDDANTNVILVNPDDNDEVRVKKFARFFSKLELDDVAGGVAAKLVEAGYTKTEELCHLTKTDFAALPGIKSSAGKLAAQIARVHAGEFDIITLMVASGCFAKGLGETRLTTLYKAKPNLFSPIILKEKPLEVINVEAASVSGFGKVAAGNLTDGLPEFWRWLKKSGAKYTLPEEEKVVEGPLTHLNFSWTGYRDQAEEDFIKSQGGKVVPFSTNKTHVLFYRVGGKSSSKVEKANLAGIKTTEFSQWGVPAKKRKANA